MSNCESRDRTCLDASAAHRDRDSFDIRHSARDYLRSTISIERPSGSSISSARVSPSACGGSNTFTPSRRSDLVERIEVLDAEGDVIEHLPARGYELLFVAASATDTLTRIPRHRSVRVAHRALRLPNRANWLERRPTCLSVLRVARRPQRARRLLAARVAHRRELHAEVRDEPDSLAQSGCS